MEQNEFDSLLQRILLAGRAGVDLSAARLSRPHRDRARAAAALEAIDGAHEPVNLRDRIEIEHAPRRLSKLSTAHTSQ